MKLHSEKNKKAAADYLEVYVHGADRLLLSRPGALRLRSKCAAKPDRA